MCAGLCCMCVCLHGSINCECCTYIYLCVCTCVTLLILRALNQDCAQLGRRILAAASAGKGGHLHQCCTAQSTCTHLSAILLQIVNYCTVNVDTLDTSVTPCTRAHAVGVQRALSYHTRTKSRSCAEGTLPFAALAPPAAAAAAPVDGGGGAPAATAIGMCAAACACIEPLKGPGALPADRTSVACAGT